MAHSFVLGFVLGAYRALAFCLQPFLLIKLWLRARKEPEYGLHIGARFGFYGKPSEAVLAGKGSWVWVHAVSLGETMATQILVQALRERQPSLKLLLTHSTATGWLAGQKILRSGDVQTWLPWDSVGAVRRFYRHFQPVQGVVMETEVWPELFLSASQYGVRLSLVNARMSERSYQGFARLPSLFHPVYAALSWVGAQSEEDAKRLRALGAQPVEVLGNLKMDARPKPEQVAAGKAVKRGLSKPVLMLASSREGEEAMFLDALEETFEKTSENTHENTLVVGAHILIVPRHPQRFDAVAALAAQRGWSVRRRSQNAGSWMHDAATNTVRTLWLGDSMGEMAFYYSLSDAVLMGGSFAPYGGQNLLEALACGCAVWVGPHTYNFAHTVQVALEVQAIVQSPNLQTACNEALQILGDATALQKRVQAGAHFLAGHKGLVHAYVRRLGLGQE